MIYGAQLMFDGDLARCQYLDETPSTITLSLDSSETVCTACGHYLRWIRGETWADEDGGTGRHCEGTRRPAVLTSPGDPAYGRPHQPDRLPLGWMSDLTIQLQQPHNDGATEWVEVSITVPGGTVKLRVEHVIADRQLIMHTTRPGDPGAPPLTASGTTYLVG